MRDEIKYILTRLIVVVIIMAASTLIIIYNNLTTLDNLYYVFSILIRLCLLIWIVVQIKKSRLTYLFRQSIWIPLILVFLIIFLKISNIYLSVNIPFIILLILHFIIISLFEEFLFRGLILFRLVKFTKSLTFSVFISSILFGLLHYINILKNSNIDQVNGIVLFAFCFGIFLSGVMLLTSNLYISSLIHFIPIFVSNNNFLQRKVFPNYNNTNSDILGSISLYFCLVLLGIIFVSCSNKKNLLKKIEGF